MISLELFHSHCARCVDSFVFSLYGTLEEEALLDNLSRAFSAIYCIEIALRIISAGGFEKFVKDPRGGCGHVVQYDATSPPIAIRLPVVLAND